MQTSLRSGEAMTFTSTTYTYIRHMRNGAYVGLMQLHSIGFHGHIGEAIIMQQRVLNNLDISKSIF